MSQKIGYIVGSLSKDSINRKLAKALARLAPEGVELVDSTYMNLDEVIDAICELVPGPRG